MTLPADPTVTYCTTDQPVDRNGLVRVLAALLIGRRKRRGREIVDRGDEVGRSEVAQEQADVTEFPTPVESIGAGWRPAPVQGVSCDVPFYSYDFPPSSPGAGGRSDRFGFKCVT